MVITVTDQTGKNLQFNALPKRIVSLVPSQTELLHALGLEDEVAGITKFCIHPEEWFRSKTIVGGTKQLHIDKIRMLKPDLLIANKEENTKEQVEELEKEFPVWISDIKTIEDAYEMIRSVGEITGKENKAQSIISSVRQSFGNLAGIKKSSAIYLIWNKPYMAAGGDTFINHMMEIAGFTNLLKDENRYPEITAGKFRELQPDVILLSSEPFPFSQKHKEEIQALFPLSKVMLVDGEMFSWYGSRMLLAAAYFKGLYQSL